ncbi:MAG: pilus assembly protein [Bauldia sp.]|nr:pilus assembly protein [Bauldia sp.]
MLSRFLHDKRGNIAMMFGLLSIPLIAATGAAVDYSRAYNQRMVVQDALDAAALAANRLIGSGTVEQITAEAEAFFQANVQGRLDLDLVFSTVVDGGTVTLTTELAVPTQFLGLVGINDIKFDLVSRTIAGAATYEVVLVLDNSTSMSGTKIATLRTAATNLVTTLFDLNVSNPRPDPVRIGLVPFAASVNVGANSTTPPSWMDTTGISPRSAINFTTDAAQLTAGIAAYGNTYTQATNTFGTFTNRFALWNTLRSVTYRGCVEARPYPYDVTDAEPTTTVPATLFVPMFAPDEPGTAGNPNNNYVNSWLSDTGGVCSSTVPSYTTTEWVQHTYPNPCAGMSGRNLRNCQRDNPNAGQTYSVQETVTHTVPLTATQLQERVCKYQNVTVGTSYRGAGQGPNYNCTTTQVRALTTSEDDITGWITAMQANGYTNIEEGVMWGWRLLSPGIPFTEGRAYDDTDNQKILIIMTDGANTYNTNSSPNRSFYSAFGFVKANFLNTTSNVESTVVSQMNARTLEACQNIADDTDIIVYTIAFQIPADQLSAKQIMADCASDSSKAFDAANNADLLEAFALIGQDIATLRLAQ